MLPSAVSLVPASCSVLMTVMVPFLCSVSCMSFSRHKRCSLVASRSSESVMISFSAAPRLMAFSTSVSPYATVFWLFPRRFMISSMISVSSTTRSCEAALSSMPDRSAS